MDDNKYRIVRQMLSTATPVAGVIMDILHNTNESFTVRLYRDNLGTFEAGVRKNILISVMAAAQNCYDIGIPVYVEVSHQA